jgi:hypothetical protein
MEERRARWHLIASKWRRWCSALGSEGGVEGNHWWITRWGERRPWCALYASLCEEKEKGLGRGSLDEEAGERRCPKEEKDGEVQYGDEGESRGPTRVQEKGGVTVQARRVRHTAAATRERHTWAPPLMAFVRHAATVTRRVKPATETTSSQALQLLQPA